MELFESWEECAKRETNEETGLTIGNIQFGYVTNDVMKEVGKHYVTIFMMGDVIAVNDSHTDQGENGVGTNANARNILLQPKNLEPDKCAGWNSYSWEELCRFASSSKRYCNAANTNDEKKGCADEHEGDKERQISLFGPLLKLVEEAPSNVVDFINNKEI